MTGTLFDMGEPPVDYYPRLCAHYSLDELLADVQPIQYQIQMYGEVMNRPRKERWIHSDSTRGYRFGGGAPVMPLTWDAVPLLADLRMWVQQNTGEEFDSCFVNVYEKGADSIAWHADDESWIGPVIASVSVGVARKFLVKRKDKTGKRHSWNIGGGDLLVMRAGMQADWLHCIPKTSKHVGTRLNATFRQTVKA